MASPSSTAQQQPPRLHDKAPSFNLDKEGRKYGVILGLITAAYLLIVNAVFADLPLGIRFAKHLFIIPIIGFAVASYAKSVPSGEVFKGELGLIFRIGVWAVGVLAVINIVLSAISPGIGFEQFLNTNETFGDAMMNSFFVAMETLVFVIIIGFVFLQYYKREGSPED